MKKITINIDCTDSLCGMCMYCKSQPYPVRGKYELILGYKASCAIFEKELKSTKPDDPSCLDIYRLPECISAGGKAE